MPVQGCIIKVGITLSNKHMRNEGNFDRALRAIVALVLLYAGIQAFPAVSGIIMLVLAVVLGITVITGYCLLYKAFGINTFRK